MTLENIGAEKNLKILINFSKKQIQINLQLFRNSIRLYIKETMLLDYKQKINGQISKVNNEQFL